MAPRLRTVSDRRAPVKLASFVRDSRGAAAAEFALVATILVYMMLNVVDLGMYVFARMQVENAAQAAAEKAYSACEGTGTLTDVTSKCSGIATVITSAAQNTSLGTSVTAQISTSPAEAYYCSNGSGGLTKVTLTPITGSQPNCVLTVLLNVSPAGDYLPITATYTYTPLFPGATASSLLSTTISKTVWIRVV
jgi:Flp pilus assembly protein TadG